MKHIFLQDIRAAVQQLDSIQADHTIYESTKKKLSMGESELQDRHIALEQLSTRFEVRNNPFLTPLHSL